MAFDSKQFRVLPMASETRVGLQNHIYAIGTSDSQAEALAAGYLDEFLDLKAPLLTRTFQPGDLVHVQYGVGTDQMNWVKCTLNWDGTTYTLVPIGNSEVVVPGPKFQTFQEAVYSGATEIRVVSDTVEVENTSLIKDITVVFENDAIVNLGEYQLLGQFHSMHVVGPRNFAAGFVCNGTTARGTFSDCRFTGEINFLNLSSFAGAVVCDSQNVCQFNCSYVGLECRPNGGVYQGPGGIGVVEIYTPSTGAGSVSWTVTAGAVVDTMVVNVQASVPNATLVVVDQQGIVNALTHTGGNSYRIVNSGVIGSIQDNGTIVNYQQGADGAQLLGGSFHPSSQISVGAYSHGSFHSINGGALAGGQGAYNSFVSCTFTTNAAAAVLELEGDFNSFMGCNLSGPVTTGAQGNNFSSCLIVGTVTITSSGNINQFIGNAMSESINDSGAGTVNLGTVMITP